MTDRAPDCRRCGKPISPSSVHRLRLTLVNAAPLAPQKHTDIADDFHHGCAALIWREATALWRGDGLDA